MIFTKKIIRTLILSVCIVLLLNIMVMAFISLSIFFFIDSSEGIQIRSSSKESLNLHQRLNSGVSMLETNDEEEEEEEDLQRMFEEQYKEVEEEESHDDDDEEEEEETEESYYYGDDDDDEEIDLHLTPEVEFLCEGQCICDDEEYGFVSDINFIKSAETFIVREAEKYLERICFNKYDERCPKKKLSAILGECEDLSSNDDDDDDDETENNQQINLNDLIDKKGEEKKKKEKEQQFALFTCVGSCIPNLKDIVHGKNLAVAEEKCKKYQMDVEIDHPSVSAKTGLEMSVFEVIIGVQKIFLDEYLIPFCSNSRYDYSFRDMMSWRKGTVQLCTGQVGDEDNSSVQCSFLKMIDEPLEY